tara:strand:- start:2813 stop:3871 length:1059 start_codon:yes stop_codon:yes gene_type:complete
MKKILISFFTLLSLVLFPEDGPMDGHHSHKMQMQGHSNTPVGLVGAAMHHHGFMFAIKQSYMNMDSNIYEGNDISSSEILSFKNPLSNTPYNLSVVPKKMNMKMTMLMGMYALSENFNLTGMATYSSKEMTLESFKPMMNREFLGSFNTSSADLSSISFGGLILLKDVNGSKTHFNIAIDKSVGDSGVKGTALTPMGSYMDMTLPYAMQLGDKGTKIDLGVTNQKKINERLSWGNQLKRKFGLSDALWSFGDQLEFNTWLQYKQSKVISLSSRLKLVHQQKISGIDPSIIAPVQTANPDNYGGKEAHLAFGANFLVGHSKISFEFVLPISQEKNNLQMKAKNMLIIGYQNSF